MWGVVRLRRLYQSLLLCLLSNAGLEDQHEQQNDEDEKQQAATDIHGTAPSLYCRTPRFDGAGGDCLSISSIQPLAAAWHSTYYVSGQYYGSIIAPTPRALTGRDEVAFDYHFGRPRPAGSPPRPGGPLFRRSARGFQRGLLHLR